MQQSLSTDADFFAAVHQMLHQDEPAEADRRITNRRPYECMQLVGPIIDGRLPDQSQFHRVLCQDLSQSGFSFMAAHPPREKHMVVALGAVPFTFVTAQVMRCTAITGENGVEYLVGCQFTGRVRAGGS